MRRTRKRTSGSITTHIRDNWHAWTAQKVEKAGDEEARYDGDDIRHTEFCSHGGRRGQEIVDHPKGVERGDSSTPVSPLSRIHRHTQFLSATLRTLSWSLSSTIRMICKSNHGSFLAYSPVGERTFPDESRRHPTLSRRPEPNYLG